MINIAIAPFNADGEHGIREIGGLTSPWTPVKQPIPSENPASSPLLDTPSTSKPPRKMSRYDVNVRLIGSQQIITIPKVLDDTSSDYWEFYQNELQILNIPANYAIRNDQLQTANSFVNRQILEVEAQLVNDGNGVGDFYRTEADYAKCNRPSDPSLFGNVRTQLLLHSYESLEQESVYL
ncbi:hypothetical protein B7463_g10319, partial [Scytalidium lignicola]